MAQAGGSLFTTRVGADGARKTLVMLHGMFGRGRNWQAIARSVTASRPDYACWLVDLPYHGGSRAAGTGTSLSDTAAAIREWIATAGVVPDAVLGHSYGGKVALALAGTWTDSPLQTWVIDSTPDAYPPSGSAWTMLRTVRSLPSSFQSRDELVNTLTSRGWTPGIAQWMSTNLTREGTDFVWALDFDVMEKLLENFFAADLWHVVETGTNGRTFHFVKASESRVLSEDAVRRAAGSTNVTVHRLEGGHWIHAEKPDAVAALLAAALPG
jgi:pimeloyl-ACP methyl ester carboxylesterase